ncbi:MAG: SIS domain-containing protein, partial [Microbacteriaceae bacterium]|nr:SIS domain-containing protein [Microbacteriaceae bacterium]
APYNPVGRPVRGEPTLSEGVRPMLGVTLGVHDYLERVCEEVKRIDRRQVENLCDLIEGRYRSGRFVFIIGNGGSGSTASHLCEDLAKCTLRDFESQRRLRVLSLTDNTPWVTAVANDIHYEAVFLEQLKNLASPGDLLLAISGSGNSPNILKAVEWANAHGMETVGITGFNGGKLKGLAHHGLHAAVDDMGIVESLHLVVFHWVIDDLNRRFSEPAASTGNGAR